MNTTFQTVATCNQENHCACASAKAAYARGEVCVRVVTLCEGSRDEYALRAKNAGLLLALVPMVLS